MDMIICVKTDLKTKYIVYENDSNGIRTHEAYA